ncbi:hypothetical protein MHM88_14690 [Epibacterium sp. MM17-32]|uniref:hypothetical protein n=1 Tax=Epibacterium sp. MM17-32 TaxID=2917734 RepID=UPI001EF514CB|nr:hypothetical protein [Epibacterium sp. MM17-32]MCG7629056.1 hypothetical protein [Epibacterium sp. MM17-32]
MKIWTITYNDDEGVRVAVHSSKAKVEDAASQWLDHYRERYPDIDFNRDWLSVVSDIKESDPSWFDEIFVEQHEVQPPAPSDLQKIMIEAVPANDDLEVDDNARVAWGGDPGAFVQTWTWVPFRDVEQDMAIIEESGTVWYFDVFEEFMEAWAGAPTTARWERGTPELLEKSEGANDAWEFLTREERRNGNV